MHCLQIFHTKPLFHQKNASHFDLIAENLKWKLCLVLNKALHNRLKAQNDVQGRIERTVREHQLAS